MKIIIFAVITSTIIPVRSVAQEARPGFDINLIVGVNIGATTPVPVPGDLGITRYNPKFNPRLGGNLTYYFNSHWGIGAGREVNWKGMKVNTRVTGVHMEIDVPDLGTPTGYVTGKNTTKVSTLYLSQPVYGTYRFRNPKWQVRGGLNFAEALSRKFSGNVRNVDIIVESPLSQEREIAYATFNYGDDTRKFDIGLLAGGEFRINHIFGLYIDFTWALSPFFSRTVPIHFTMRNVYLSAGATFRL